MPEFSWSFQYFGELLCIGVAVGAGFALAVKLLNR